MKKNEKQKIKAKTALTVHLSVAALGTASVAASLIAFGINSGRDVFNLSEMLNFSLFRTVSLSVTGILLVLTLLSRLSCEITKRPSAFTVRIAGISPVISAVAILGATFFYAYLTYGIKITTEPYIVALGVGEAMLFALPGVLKILPQLKTKEKNK